MDDAARPLNAPARPRDIRELENVIHFNLAGAAPSGHARPVEDACRFAHRALP